MLFHEYAFLFVFLPLLLAIYHLSPDRARNLVVFAGNCVFYAASSWFFLPLLLATISVDYWIGNRLHAAPSDRARRRWLLVSLVSNLGALGYFKYIGFITSTLRGLPGLEGVPLVEAPLPAGISFYVFQSMSYTLDLYRRKVTPARSFVDFGAFVTLFPHLIAGPIVRYDNVKDQLVSRSHDAPKLASGMYLLIIGLAKKLLVADTLASLADPIFDSPADPGLLGAWASILLYSGQIYFDFSGYSDMAIGLGRLVGFELPMNFCSPYKSEGFSEFWRRWHITLSSWLRDYLYVSLGGNRRGPTRTLVNLFLTMFLGGLWHGASWNFALWGMIHGGYLAVERVLGARSPMLRWPWWARRTFVFLAVTVAWTFFRIDHLDQSLRWIAAMFTGAGGLGTVEPEVALALAGMMWLLWVPRSSQERSPTYSPLELGALAACFVLSIIAGYGRGISPFLYFRF